MNNLQFLDALKNGNKTIAILRGVTPTCIIEVCDIMEDAGIRLIEIPLNSPGALESIKKASEYYCNNEMIYIGAGTVLDVENVKRVADVGGKYIISPNTNPEVINASKNLNLVSIPGFMTPTEAFIAINSGADMLKCFPPVSPENISILKSVISAPIIAVGGITKYNKRKYLSVSDGIGVGVGFYRPDISINEVKEAVRSFFSID